MTDPSRLTDHPRAIYTLCLAYGLHMVEEFSCGFVPWADRYFGRFDWTQNLIGNLGFLLALAFACRLYHRDPVRFRWAGAAGCMWVLTNAFIHASSTLLGGEYSPGLVTALVLYVPLGTAFLVRWWRRGELRQGTAVAAFAVGGLAFMLIPTVVRAVIYRAEFARMFHLV